MPASKRSSNALSCSIAASAGGGPSSVEVEASVPRLFFETAHRRRHTTIGLLFRAFLVLFGPAWLDTWDAIGEKPFSQQRLAWVEDLGHEFVLSTLVCAVATVVGLQGFWPHPHQDPQPWPGPGPRPMEQL